MAEQLWQIAMKKVGGQYKFACAADLAKVACDYFEWCKNTPINDVRKIQRKGNTDEVNRVQMTDGQITRPMTKSGFELYAGIGNWQQWKKDNYNREGFAEVIDMVSKIIENDQQEGAITGIYEHNIIARLNGYADTTRRLNDTPMQILPHEAR